MKESFEYNCQFFRQRPKSSVQCTFLSTTADVHEWAGVPVKTSSDPRNFQRPEIKGHADEIAEFFNTYEENASPSSIVVGFREPVECLNNEGNQLDLSTVTPGKVVSGKIRIKSFVLDPTKSLDEKRQLLKAIVASILSQDAHSNT